MSNQNPSSSCTDNDLATSKFITGADLFLSLNTHPQELADWIAPSDNAELEIAITSFDD